MTSAPKCGRCADTTLVDGKDGWLYDCGVCGEIVRLNLKDLGRGVGHTGIKYNTAVAHTSRTIEFYATSAIAILRDVCAVTAMTLAEARLTGSRSAAQCAIAIENRVRVAVSEYERRTGKR